MNTHVQTCSDKGLYIQTYAVLYSWWCHWPELSLKPKLCQFFALIIFLPFTQGVCFTKSSQYVFSDCTHNSWAESREPNSYTMCCRKRTLSVNQWDHMVLSVPAVQTGGSCLNFGCEKWCVCLKNTEIPHPEHQDMLLVLLKNQESLMPTNTNGRRFSLIIC